MTELERATAIASVIHYWLPYGWLHGAHRYTLLSLILIGDVVSGGADLSVLRDDATTATIQFTNDECYGDMTLAPSVALQRVYDGTYA